MNLRRRMDKKVIDSIKAEEEKRPLENPCLEFKTTRMVRADLPHISLPEPITISMDGIQPRHRSDIKDDEEITGSRDLASEGNTELEQLHRTINNDDSELKTAAVFAANVKAYIDALTDEVME